MTKNPFARLSVIVGLTILCLALASTAYATIRDWSGIVDQDACQVTGSGARVTVNDAGNGTLLANIPGGSYGTWHNNGPVSLVVTVWLQRDNAETSPVFTFDCQEAPPSSTTTTIPGTTSTTQPTPPTSTVPPSSTTTTPPTTTTHPPVTSSTAPTTTSVPSTTSTTPPTTTTDSVPPSTTTDDPCGPGTLPCTGSDLTAPLAVAGIASLLLGAAAVRASQVTRRERNG